MLAVYDCGAAPPGWEFLSFLVSAELHRRQLRPDERITIDVIKLIGTGNRAGGLPRLEQEVFWRWYDEVMHPLARMLPKVASCGVRDAPRRTSDLVFPYGYDNAHRIPHHDRSLLLHAFANGVFPLDAEGEKDLEMITITPGPDVKAWIPAAEYLRTQGRVVFVTDDPVPGFEARKTHSVTELSRLYVSSRMNFGADTACAWMAACMPRAPFFLFEPQQMRPGYQIGRPGFKLVYEAPSPDVVQREFEANFRDHRAAPVFLDKDHPMEARWLANMEVNCARGLPWFNQSKPTVKPAVICAGGSSLADNWRQVRHRKALGQPIIACNGSGAEMIRRGIVPDYVLALDANPRMAEYFFQATHPDTTYLIASCCDPSLFDHLLDRGCKVVTWHAAMANPEPEAAILKHYAQQQLQWPTTVGGSVTIGARAFILAYMMGHRDLHFYGMDSCYRSGKHHAYDHPHKGLNNYQRVGFPGATREYDAASWMVRQADEFRDTYFGLRKMGVKFHPHGDGLIPDMCRYMNKHYTQEKAAA